MKKAEQKEFSPYADESTVLTLQNMTIENRLDRVALQGDMELTLDQRGLALAKQLQAVVNQVVQALEQEKELPAEVKVKSAETVKNPFG